MTRHADALRPACVDHDPELFFPLGEQGRPGPQPKVDPQVERAKTICGGCPARQDCLQGALERQEAFGVWGGLTSKERRELLRRQGAGEAPRRTPGPTSRVDVQRVARMTAQGQSAREIAQTLTVTPRTVIRARNPKPPVVRKPLVVREAKPCGTYAAYIAHHGRGEEPCEPCREAKRKYNREYMRKRRATA